MAGRWGMLIASVLVIVAGCTEAPVVSSPGKEIPSGGGWGPERELFTMQHPAGFATFNSITDNPDVGDERNFFRIKTAGDEDATYENTALLRAGQVYSVMVYYQNSASPGLPSATARDVRVSVRMPGVVTTTAKASAFISSSNTTPPQVWGSLTLAPQDGEYALRYIPGTARLHTGGAADGMSLPPDDLFSEAGALVGCDALDGIVSGEERCAGYVMFDVIADQADFSVDLGLRVGGSGEFGSTVTATPGDVVRVRVVYQNTGTTEQRDVVVSAELVAGTTIVPNSLRILNASNPEGALIAGPVEAIIEGVNIGAYTAGSNALVTYDLRIQREGALECGGKWLFVNAAVSTNNGIKNSAEGVIDVEGVC